VTHPFTLAGYEDMLSAFRGLGYSVVGFSDVAPDRRHLVLRHDLDMSIPAGLELAEREAAHGISAHYFVLMRSGLYNPRSAEASRALCRLVDLGHAVGLHFDAALYADDDAELEAGCVAECASLEDLLGQPVEMISFHRPSIRLQGMERSFAGRPHAYEPRYFSAIGYCSDSRGEWRHGPPLEHPAVAAGRALQLLTHPIWWTREPGETAVERLDRLRVELDRRLARELAANCDIYRVPAQSERLAG
jgi:hypothetical protein